MELLTEDPCVLEEKLLQLAKLWHAANGKVVVFTGAGFSTAAGLPDYRGPQGLWTLRLQGKVVDESSLLAMRPQPTAAHGVLTRLHALGRLAHVATTNVDGLHSLAGLPEHALSELHGNLYTEECSICLARYRREFPVRCATGLRDHLTGRSCESCEGGALRDIIVNFGNTVEEVPSMEAQHDQAWMQCLKAELVVVLGSSLSVPTACDLPEECIAPRFDKPSGGRLVIVNLQRTPKDEIASLSIRARCDEVLLELERLLQKLDDQVQLPGDC